jgi:hypothetical protein
LTQSGQWPPPYGFFPTYYDATTNGSAGQQHAPSRFHHSNFRIGAHVPVFGALLAQSASVLFVGELSFETN